MKKKIALLILLALALTVILTACGQTSKTTIIPRWSTDGESYVYKVTLADLAVDGSSTRFNAYKNPNPDDNVDYYKDFDVRSGEPLDSKDEVRPADVEGTFEISITSKESGNVTYDTVTTSQNITVSYEYKDGKIKSVTNSYSGGRIKTVEAWIDLPAALEALGEKTEKDGVTYIAFTSKTDTTVEFRHDDKQAPQKSWTKVEGFYIGKTNQEASGYEVTTEYKYESKNTVVSIELKANGKTEKITDTLKRRTEDSFIDSNQLFMYTRSFDKTSGSFQDSPAVAVYNPLTQKLHTTNFSFTASVNAYLTNGDQKLYAKLPSVGVVIDGKAFMQQTSAPNLLEAKADRTRYADNACAKHTPVRFRVGYLSFELQYGSDLWEALSTYSKGEK